MINVYDPMHASKATNLTTIFNRRESLTSKLFGEICSNTSRKLHHLLPERNAL